MSENDVTNQSWGCQLRAWGLGSLCSREELANVTKRAGVSSEVFSHVRGQYGSQWSPRLCWAIITLEPEGLQWSFCLIFLLRGQESETFEISSNMTTLLPMSELKLESSSPSSLSGAFSSLGCHLVSRWACWELRGGGFSSLACLPLLAGLRNPFLLTFL